MMKLITVFHTLDFCTSSVQQYNSQIFHHQLVSQYFYVYCTAHHISAIYTGHLQGVGRLLQSNWQTVSVN